MRIGAGARPNFMKIARLMWEIERRTGIDAYLVHLGPSLIQLSSSFHVLWY